MQSSVLRNLKKVYSDAGTRTRVAWVKTRYPNQLDYVGLHVVSFYPIKEVRANIVNTSKIAIAKNLNSKINTLSQD